MDVPTALGFGLAPAKAQKHKMLRQLEALKVILMLIAADALFFAAVHL